MRFSPVMRLAVVVAVASLVTVSPSTAVAQVSGPAKQLVAIPAYWGPNTPAGMAMFDRLAGSYPTNDLVVINGSQSKPETPFNSAWATAIKKVHDAGSLALVYVDTGYYGFTFPPAEAHKTRPEFGSSTRKEDWTAQIKSDIDGWYQLYGSYGVDGIFLDQTISTCGTDDMYVDLYAAISDYISARHPQAYIVINPGESPQQCYANIADTIMSMERDMNTYMNNYTPSAWELNYPNPKKFWHAVYATPTTADMRAVIARSKANNAGYVYVTERPLIPFPWDTIASYWDDELIAAAGAPDTVPPTEPGRPTATTRTGSATARAYLTWDTSTDNVGIRAYQVYRNGVQIGRTDSNTFTATDLTPSTSYTFVVKAVDLAGNVSSASSPRTVTTLPVGPSLANPAACLSPTTAKYSVAYNDTYTHRRVFIDSDDKTDTGYLGVVQGADFMIENGLLYASTGSAWGWIKVDNVAPLVSDAEDIFRWQVPKSAFGSGAATRQVVAFNGWDEKGVTPEAYTTPQTIDQTASC